jgi:hypothetical protein
MAGRVPDSGLPVWPKRSLRYVGQGLSAKQAQIDQPYLSANSDKKISKSEKTSL